MDIDHRGSREPEGESDYLVDHLKKYPPPNRHAHSNTTNRPFVIISLLSLYSTVTSGLWLAVAIAQPRWGKKISSNAGLDPSIATTIAALLAKTIELSFVTVFICYLGQVLTRRASAGSSKGVSLAEMMIRNWIMQPGSLITHGETVPTAGLTLFGALTLVATIASTFFTTASDAMVAPKLKHGIWESTQLSEHVLNSYANVMTMGSSCPKFPDLQVDEQEMANACMSFRFSTESYRDLMSFMTDWSNATWKGALTVSSNLPHRPVPSSFLLDNTPVSGSWIETSTANVTKISQEHGRIINNVSLAMPHPGVYSAALAPHNNILQPVDLAGVGEYSIRASVVSPSLNVLCVNMHRDELRPLVYTEWPNAKTVETDIPGQFVGWERWYDDVPRHDYDGPREYLNRTVVDDIFKWGPKYDSQPPIFQIYPPDYNMLANSTVFKSDSFYILAKNSAMENFTLCGMKSWLSTKCSTRLDVSGADGVQIKPHCEDENDKDSYMRSFPETSRGSQASPDWKWVADFWRLSMDLNGGVAYNNATNARVLTQFALPSPFLSFSQPSMAEALAAYACGTLIRSAIGAPFVHYWSWNRPSLEEPGPLQAFNASIRSQQYTSGHVASWQAVFYLVLGLVFAMNLLCLAYFLRHLGLMTDFTEPHNIFTFAIKSSTSPQIKGVGESGPTKEDFVLPWWVGYAAGTKRYIFKEVGFKDSDGDGRGDD